MPTGVAGDLPDYHRDHWEPLWAAAEEAGMVLGFHIGSDNDSNEHAVPRPGWCGHELRADDVRRPIRRR